jgi:hypothetical protein
MWKRVRIIVGHGVYCRAIIIRYIMNLKLIMSNLT